MASLLTTTASGAYLIRTNHTSLAGHGWAKIIYGAELAKIGFYPVDTRPYAATGLDSSGSIGADMVLRYVVPSVYQLHLKAGAGIRVRYPPCIRMISYNGPC